MTSSLNGEIFIRILKSLNMPNLGTVAGTLEEAKFVKSFNQGMYGDFVSRYFPNTQSIFAVHVTTNQLSLLNNKIVKPKADAYLITAPTLTSYDLNKTEHYLNEDILNTFEYEIVPNSGISVKRPDSDTYQIHKFTTNSFVAVFNDAILGAGASIYIDNENHRTDNVGIIAKWGVSSIAFTKYFAEKLSFGSSIPDMGYAAIQRFCLDEIKNLVTSNRRLSEIVFSGKGIFESPYFAEFSYTHGVLEKLQFIDFYVSQGSNRKTNPTIVFKPKQG